MISEKDEAYEIRGIFLNGGRSKYAALCVILSLSLAGERGSDRAEQSSASKAVVATATATSTSTAAHDACSQMS